MKKFSLPKLVISLPVAALVAIALIVINEISFQQSVDAAASVNEAQQTSSLLNKLTEQVLDAESGQRGYLLTGDPAYLMPYQLSTAKINQQLEKLRQILAPYPSQRAEFNILSNQIASKMAEMDLSMRMRKDGNEDVWKFVLTTDVGKKYMQSIRQESDSIAANNQNKMESAQIQFKKTLVFSRLGVAVVALGGLLAFYMYLMQTKALFETSVRAQESLKRERDQLDLQVRERTANLAELATHLQNVREDERGHLARELHDELGALLTAAKLDVARLKSRLGDNLPEAAERIAHLISTLNSGIALKRRIVEDLRPSSLSHLGLVASLEILTREFEESSGLSTTTDLENVELSSSAELTVYRLVQESLTNITKYAQASEIVVSLLNTGSLVTVEVSDNGKGFDPQDISPGSHGLNGMRHRVEAAGGKLKVSSTQNAGTCISAVLPKNHS